MKLFDFLPSGENNPLKTEREAKAYMLKSTSATDWQSRTQHILELHGYALPNWWFKLITTDADLRKKKIELEALQERDNSWRRK